MTRRACQRFALVPSVLLAAGLVFAEEAEAKWETIVKGSITVKNRARPESAVKEVWAQGEIAAPLQDIQATLVNPGNFKNFMPYLKGSWEIHKPEADGSVYVYTQLDFPMLTDRDYVCWCGSTRASRPTVPAPSASTGWRCRTRFPRAPT